MVYIYVVLALVAAASVAFVLFNGAKKVASAPAPKKTVATPVPAPVKDEKPKEEPKHEEKGSEKKEEKK